MTRAITLSGTGLHSGIAAEVTLERARGPITFETERGRMPLADVQVVRTDRGVQIAAPSIGLDLDGVEHFLAALGGLGIHSGVSVRVSGGEFPLLDGAALEFCRALKTMKLEPRASELAIVKYGELRHGDSVYRFEPTERTALHVQVEFAAKKIGAESAHWDGAPDAFIEEIAWARTFGFLHEARALTSVGRSRGATPRSVLVLGEDGAALPPSLPARPGEFARHKLLDLVGDLYLHGGPPRGTIHARRPGHTATRAVFQEARARGIVVRGSGPSAGSSL